MRVLTAIAAAGLMTSAANAQVFDFEVGPSTEPWLVWMNVTEPGGGGWGSGWDWGAAGIFFDDAAPNVTMMGTYIDDTNEYWYEDPSGTGDPNPGGPGVTGKNTMESNLYQEFHNGDLGGATVNFHVNVLDLTFVDGYEATIFVKDFAPDYSSSVDSIVPITGTGAFSVSLDTIDDPTRHVQFGLQVTGLNMWSTDLQSKGYVVYEQVPAPASVALLGLGGLMASRRRR
jgi:hypothetical protein